MNLINIQQSINRPWLILPSALDTFRKQYEQLFSGNIQMPMDMPTDMPDDEPMNDETGSMDSGSMENTIAVISIDGIIGKRLGLIETMFFGMTDVNNISDAIDEAMVDPNIDTVVFDMCTPGGTVTGVPELANKIAEMSKVKNTIAYADVLCASAGYYLASQCNAIYSAPTATVGSVGVYSIYFDETVALSNDGIKINAISAGKYKLTGFSGKVMTDEERAMLQVDIDKIYSQFKSAVISKRAIADEDLQGQCFTSDDLINKNFIDGFANSLDDVISFLTK